jgi:hypothetical protein
MSFKIQVISGRWVMSIENCRKVKSFEVDNGDCVPIEASEIAKAIRVASEDRQCVKAIVWEGNKVNASLKGPLFADFLSARTDAHREAGTDFSLTPTL